MRTSTRTRSSAVVVLVLAGLLVWTWNRGGSPASQRRPNVLLVSIDTLRADHLGCYGYPRDTSPNLDRIARDGVCFERAVSTTSWTLPAHVSMLTGLPISVHGICDDRLWSRTDAIGRRIPPPLRGTFVSETLQAAGYATAGFFSFDFLDSIYGFGLGFDAWERCGADVFSDPELRDEFLALRAAGEFAAIEGFLERNAARMERGRRTTPETLDRAIAWLDQHERDEPKDPFFLFVHLFDVHDPYKPPPEYDRFGDPAYSGSIDGRIDTSKNEVLYTGLSRADIARRISLYDGGIAFVDHQLGRLFDRLGALGVDENTLVIVTSDHGEEFFEHGRQGHHRQLYMESLHVPLLMRWPARFPADRRVEGTVGLIDIVPTVLAAAGVRAPNPLSGADLAPFARGEQANGGRMYVSLLNLFEARGAGQDQAHKRIESLIRGDEQVLVSWCQDQAPRIESWDLAEDPRELGAVRLLDWADIEPQFESIARSFRSLRERQPDRSRALPEGNRRLRAILAANGYASSDDVDSVEASGRLCLDGCVFWR
ncbi:MAG: sulfatase [Planctomycetes bacterium]|nr:sulfatase [Planctomycetota bacterium]